MTTDSSNCGGTHTLTLYNHKLTKNSPYISTPAAYICVLSNAAFLAKIPIFQCDFLSKKNSSSVKTFLSLQQLGYFDRVSVLLQRQHSRMHKLWKVAASCCKKVIFCSKIGKIRYNYPKNVRIDVLKTSNLTAVIIIWLNIR